MIGDSLLLRGSFGLTKFLVCRISSTMYVLTNNHGEIKYMDINGFYTNREYQLVEHIEKDIKFTISLFYDGHIAFHFDEKDIDTRELQMRRALNFLEKQKQNRYNSRPKVYRDLSGVNVPRYIYVTYSGFTTLTDDIGYARGSYRVMVCNDDTFSESIRYDIGL